MSSGDYEAAMEDVAFKTQIAGMVAQPAPGVQMIPERDILKNPDGRPTLQERVNAALDGRDLRTESTIERLKAVLADRMPTREYLALMTELGLDPRLGL